MANTLGIVTPGCGELVLNNVRSQECDRAMVEIFGKPDFSRTGPKNGLLYTPMGDRNDFWRIDPSLDRGWFSIAGDRFKAVSGILYKEAK